MNSILLRKTEPNFRAQQDSTAKAVALASAPFGWKPCAAIVAVVMFVAGNAALWKLDQTFDFTPGRRTMQQFDLERTVRDFPSQRRFTFAGSSLVLYPLWKVDRPKYTSCGDANHYHRSQYFEQCLSSSGQPDCATYDLAVGGAMASDVYLLAKNYVSRTSGQQWIIWGCAPRDFYDNNAPTPASTLIYRHLFRDSDLLSSDAALYEPDLGKRFYSLLSHCVFFINHNREIADAVTSFFQQNVVSPLVAQVSGSNRADQKSVSVTVGRPVASRIDRASSAPRHVTPVSPVTVFDVTNSDRSRLRESSLNEYRARYRNISSAAMDRQMQFAQRLIDLCHERSINLLVVNMPLSTDNRGLLPVDCYEDFCSRLATMTAKSSAHYIDLSRADEFQESDFDDTVHLNASGGVKLINRILPALQPVNNEVLSYDRR